METKMFVKKRQLKSKQKTKGFSLVEVIISMALTVILSLIAFAICSVCINVGGKNNIKNFFMVESRNFVSAYFLGESKYSNALNLLTGENLAFGDDTTLYYSKDLKITDQANSKYKVNIIFGDKFEVQCQNLDNTAIYQIEV